MSRSYRNVPITGATAVVSEKSWKSSCSRKRRRLEKNILSQLPTETPDIIDPTVGTYGPKEGKHYWDDEAINHELFGSQIRSMLRK